MKNLLLISSLLFIMFLSVVNAQCTAIANSFGNNSIMSYNITGTNSVQVVLNTNNTITLNLMSNFVTANGPDVRAYLVAPGSLTDFMLKNTPVGNLTRIEMGMVSNSTTNASGAKTFTKMIPAGANISNYSKVFFYCAAAAAFWDMGNIVPFTGANCAFLGVDKVDEISGLNIYPNPVQDFLILESNFNDKLALKIYDLRGSLILQNENLIGNRVDLQSLSNGLYLAEVTNAENKRTVKRFVKN